MNTTTTHVLRTKSGFQNVQKVKSFYSNNHRYLTVIMPNGSMQDVRSERVTTLRNNPLKRLHLGGGK